MGGAGGEWYRMRSDSCSGNSTQGPEGQDEECGFYSKYMGGSKSCFPVVMYGRESWTIRKAEHRRTDAFEL